MPMDLLFHVFESQENSSKRFRAPKNEFLYGSYEVSPTEMLSAKQVCDPWFWAASMFSLRTYDDRYVCIWYNYTF